ncbi:alpha-amylase 2-like [Cochliomyia hominivorax]
MRLKSFHTHCSITRKARTTATVTTTITSNQHWLKTCVGNMFIFFYLLSSQVVWSSYINIKEQRIARQVNVKNNVNYEENDITNLYHQPHFTGNRSVIVQLFEWKFVDVAAECRDFLGPKGYAGVLISPVLEHSLIKTSTLKHPWWERYEFISYRLASRSGDESEFWSMSRICNDHGVRIYADVVLNHMAAPPQNILPEMDDNQQDFIVNTLLETSVNISQQFYSNVTYTQQDFHRPECLVLSNTQDAHEIRNCQLNGHPDLDLSRATVQQHIVEMLNKFIDMGVAGFRIDTAKYIWPIDLKKIFKQVKNLNTEFNFKKNSRPFLYYDVFDLGLDPISKTEYTTYGVVSEYLYPAELSNIIKGKVPLSSLINWGPALGFLTHQDSLVFIDSHDTQRGLPEQLGHNKMLTYKQRLKYIMANVFMLVHPYGHIKRIMSSYYFNDENQGPPEEDEESEEIRSPAFNKQQQCTKESGWVCEHRWPELVSVLKVANYFRGPGQEDYSVIYFQTNGPNQVAFCRGHKAFVAINNDWERDFIMDVFACLEPGTYCDMVTGGKKEGKEECHGKQVVINEQGYVKLHLAVADGNNEENVEENEIDDEVEEEEMGRLENYGILVIYVESKINSEGNGENINKAEVEEENHEEGNIHQEVENEELETIKIDTKEDDNDAEDDDDQKDENGDQEELEINDSKGQADGEVEVHNEEVNDEKVQENDEEKEKDVKDEEGSKKETELDVEALTEPNENVANKESDGNNDNEQESENKQEVEDVTPGETNKAEKPVEGEDNNEIEDISDPAETTDAEESSKEEIVNEEPEAETPDEPTEDGKAELVEENSQEIEESPAENLVEELEIETQATNEITKHDQSRNLEEKSPQAEEQIEQPKTGAEDEKEVNNESVNPQDTVAAGILSKSKGGNNNG